MSKRYMDFVPAKNADKKAAVASGAPRRTNVVMPEPTATPRTRMARKSVTVKRSAQRVNTQKATSPQKTVSSQRVIYSQRVVSPQRTESSQRMVRRTTLVQKSEALRPKASVKSASSEAKFAIRDDSKLGEIEDLSPKFVKMDVPKRPLGDNTEHRVAAKQSALKSEVKEAKSKKLIGRFRSKAATKAAAKAPSNAEKKVAQKQGTFVAPRPAFINQDKVAKRPLSKNVYQKNIVATEEKVSKGPVAIITKPEKESKAGLIVAIILTIILGAVAGTIAFLLLPK